MLSRILILLLGFAGGVRAQTVAISSPEVFWQLTATANTLAASPANEATIRQAGTSNQATVDMLGQQNQIALTQTATANAATIQLTGQGNQVLLTQSGGSNRLAVGLDGMTNYLRISQSGGDIASMTGLSGSNARIDLIQRDGDNTLIADGLTIPGGASGGVAKLKIEQSGGAMARIQNGRL